MAAYLQHHWLCMPLPRGAWLVCEACSPVIAAAPTSYFAANSGIFTRSAVTLLNCGGDKFCLPRYQEVVVSKWLTRLSPRTNSAILDNSLSLFCGLTRRSLVTVVHHLPYCMIWRFACPPCGNSVKTWQHRICVLGALRKEDCEGETSVQGNCGGKLLP